LPKVAFPSAKAIIGFITAMAILEFIVRIWSPVNSWLPFGLFEPAHFPQYILMFFAGLMAYRNDWLSKIPQGATVKWLSIAAWSFAAFGIMYAFWGDAMFKGGLTFPSLGMAVWESIMCVSMNIGLVALFKTRFNSTSAIQKTLSNDAFTAYLVHVPIIVGLQLLLVDVAVPSLAKFAVVSIVGTPLTFFLSDLIKKLPYTKKIL
jgi:surface polysaccharide O-acyltransferase-like enzyme